jgi:citrate lyase synthetase
LSVFRGLHEIGEATKQAVTDLLSKKRLPGLATWKQVARRYAMRETEISLLEIEKTPAGAMLDRLASLAPNQTVYYLCKTFKEPGLRRQDIVNILLKQMLASLQ